MSKKESASVIQNTQEYIQAREEFSDLMLEQFRISKKLHEEVTGKKTLITDDIKLSEIEKVKLKHKMAENDELMNVYDKMREWQNQYQYKFEEPEMMKIGLEATFKATLLFMIENGEKATKAQYKEFEKRIKEQKIEVDESLLAQIKPDVKEKRRGLGGWFRKNKKEDQEQILETSSKAESQLASVGSEPIQSTATKDEEKNKNIVVMSAEDASPKKSVPPQNVKATVENEDEMFSDARSQVSSGTSVQSREVRTEPDKLETQRHANTSDVSRGIETTKPSVTNHNTAEMRSEQVSDESSIKVYDFYNNNDDRNKAKELLKLEVKDVKVYLLTEDEVKRFEKADNKVEFLKQYEANSLQGDDAKYFIDRALTLHIRCDKHAANNDIPKVQKTENKLKDLYDLNIPAIEERINLHVDKLEKLKKLPVESIDNTKFESLTRKLNGTKSLTMGM